MSIDNIGKRTWKPLKRLTQFCTKSSLIEVLWKNLWGCVNFCLLVLLVLRYSRNLYFSSDEVRKKWELALLYSKGNRSEKEKACQILKELLASTEASSVTTIPSILYTLSLTSYALSEWKEAEEYCTDLLELVPAHPQVCIMAVIVFWSHLSGQGQELKAAIMYKKKLQQSREEKEQSERAMMIGIVAGAGVALLGTIISLTMAGNKKK